MVAPPRYARYSPDTPSDESSDEELPNFTLLSEESILPEGSKRVRTQKVPLIFDDAPPSPPRRSRRSRPRWQSSNSHDSRDPVLPFVETTRKTPPYSSRISREQSLVPRKFKRRRIVTESPSPDFHGESGISEDADENEGEEEEDEEPIRPMSSRRSINLSITSTETKAATEAQQESDVSSELSSPPDSDIDVEHFQEFGTGLRLQNEVTSPISSKEESEPVFEVTAEKHVASLNKPSVKPVMKKGRSPSEKKEKGTTGFEQCKTSPTRTSSIPGTDVDIPQRSLDRITLASHTNSTLHDVMPDSFKTLTTNVNLSVKVSTKATKYDQNNDQLPFEQSVTNDNSDMMPTSLTAPVLVMDKRDAIMTKVNQLSATASIDSKLGLAVMARPDTYDRVVVKKTRKKIDPKTKNVINPQASQLPSASKVTLSEQAANNRRPTSSISSQDWQSTQRSTTLPVDEESRRAKEISKDIRTASIPPSSVTRPALQVISSTTRPASTGVLRAVPHASSLQARNHTRHRSMEIASLLNDDDQSSPPKQRDPTTSMPLGYLVESHQHVAHISGAAESFMRNSPAPMESFVRSSAAPHRRNLSSSTGSGLTLHLPANSLSILAPTEPDAQNQKITHYARS